jgi:hypothetical protein
MPRISFSGILPIAERVYHASLFIYPEEHRREYGPLMVQVFRDLCRDMYQRRGMLGLVKLWSHVLLDTTVTAVAEHAYELKTSHLTVYVCTPGTTKLRPAKHWSNVFRPNVNQFERYSNHGVLPGLSNVFGHF